jgi:uncharacterized protein (UPF0305 family)
MTRIWVPSRPCINPDCDFLHTSERKRMIEEYLAYLARVRNLRKRR